MELLLRLSQHPPHRAGQGWCPTGTTSPLGSTQHLVTGAEEQEVSGRERKRTGASGATYQCEEESYWGKSQWKVLLRGNQKIIPALSRYSPFYTTNSWRKKKTPMTFSTPFTCTEVIAHVKTLKCFALASKISVGAEDRSQNFFIPVFQTTLNASILVFMWLLTTLSLFLYVSFFFMLPYRWEKSLDLIILMLPPNHFHCFFHFFFFLALRLSLSSDQILGKPI